MPSGSAARQEDIRRKKQGKAASASVRHYLVRRPWLATKARCATSQPPVIIRGTHELWSFLPRDRGLSAGEEDDAGAGEAVVGGVALGVEVEPEVAEAEEEEGRPGAEEAEQGLAD